MDTKKTLYHLFIRLGILIAILVCIFLYGFIKVDFFAEAFFLIQAYCLFLLLEMIYFFVKKFKNLALIDLGFLIVLEILPVLVFTKLMV
ncbi:hypothetical protein [Flavobacterium sp. 2]|uniref:hypothetical protein n=1 Tax=Flavobacterium sp. 2 TaxID=308053 RepID=UPI003CE68DB3